MAVAVRSIRRADRAVIGRFAEHRVATISEAQGRPPAPATVTGKLSLGVNNMRERQAWMGLTYTEQGGSG